jgi:hypothetical protein
MSSSESTPHNDRLTQLGDRQEIAELIARLGVMLDERRFEDAESILTEDVTVSTPGGSSRGREAVAAQARRNHTVRTQHVITDVVIQFDGNTAQAHANLIVTFAPDRPGSSLAINGYEQPDPYLTLGQRYRFGAVRTEGGWRLARIETEPLWSSRPLAPGAVITEIGG